MLSFFFYISGIITAVFASFLLLHVAMFGGMAAIPDSAWNQPAKSSPPATQPTVTLTPTPTPKPSEAPPRIMFAIFAGIAGMIMFIGWTIGGLTIYAGRCIKKRKNYVFVIVISALKCIFVPYGTLLGVLSLIVLSKPHIRSLFYSTAAA